nr:hypothetical protein Iba_chr11dCG5550 [Ipomoea batatas]
MAALMIEYGGFAKLIRTLKHLSGNQKNKGSKVEAWSSVLLLVGRLQFGCFTKSEHSREKKAALEYKRGSLRVWRKAHEGQGNSEENRQDEQEQEPKCEVSGEYIEMGNEDGTGKEANKEGKTIVRKRSVRPQFNRAGSDGNILASEESVKPSNDEKNPPIQGENKSQILSSSQNEDSAQNSTQDESS